MVGPRRAVRCNGVGIPVVRCAPTAKHTGIPALFWVAPCDARARICRKSKTGVHRSNQLNPSEAGLCRCIFKMDSAVTGVRCRLRSNNTHALGMICQRDAVRLCHPVRSRRSKIRHPRPAGSQRIPSRQVQIQVTIGILPQVIIPPHEWRKWGRRLATVQFKFTSSKRLGSCDQPLLSLVSGEGAVPHFVARSNCLLRLSK